MKHHNQGPPCIVKIKYKIFPTTLYNDYQMKLPKFVYVFGAETHDFWRFQPASFLAETVLFCIFVF